ncbi:hypothetical protein HAX54_035187, partial [Datura stramonium]|nr:hypothetical protein [Datura stramonium]
PAAAQPSSSLPRFLRPPPKTTGHRIPLPFLLSLVFSGEHTVALFPLPPLTPASSPHPPSSLPLYLHTGHQTSIISGKRRHHTTPPAPPSPNQKPPAGKPFTYIPRTTIPVSVSLFPGHLLRRSEPATTLPPLTPANLHTSGHLPSPLTRTTPKRQPPDLPRHSRTPSFAHQQTADLTPLYLPLFSFSSPADPQPGKTTIAVTPSFSSSLFSPIATVAGEHPDLPTTKPTETVALSSSFHFSGEPSSPSTLLSAITTRHTLIVLV